MVRSNLAISLDGKIATASRAAFSLGTPEDRRRMGLLRRWADVVVFGASTLRTWRKPCVAPGQLSGKGRIAANAVVSGSLAGISPKWPFFASPRLPRIIFTRKGTAASRLAPFRDSCKVIALSGARAGGLRASSLLRELRGLGYRKILVEGGGALMWDFARENLIDEYFVTLTPKIVGGTEAPTLVDGKGFDPKDILGLRLKRCERVGDELYLTYSRID